MGILAHGVGGFAAALLAGCVVYSPAYVPDPKPLDSARLPAADREVEIPGLRPCTDSPDAVLRFSSAHPVAVLVHGCNGSAGNFRALAQLYAFHGQQAACFTYDGRERLGVSAGKLVAAVDTLAGHISGRRVSVIGHSMGGLVAREAMEADRRSQWRQGEADITLLTVSAPIAGIAVAGPCGNRALHWLSFGFVPGLCWYISGDNWFEITPASDFIRKPGPLLPAVRRYLKVVTDERGTCRRRNESGTCLESDHIFSLAEQYQPAIERYPQLTNVEVKAGHVEIVGYRDVAPRKLLEILQAQGMLAPTPPERRSALERLLAELY
jgi:hypothetical protein